jgi:hypothetical protein
MHTAKKNYSLLIVHFSDVDILGTSPLTSKEEASGVGVRWKHAKEHKYFLIFIPSRCVMTGTNKHRKLTLTIV